MTLRKILVLSIILAASPFGAAWATQEFLDGAEGHGSVSPVTVVVDTEKAEGDNRPSLIEMQTDEPQVGRAPMTKAELYERLFGYKDISRGYPFFPTKFDLWLEGLESACSTMLADLKQKVASEGLEKVTADGWAEFSLRQKEDRQKGELSPPGSFKPHESVDLSDTVTHMYLLFQTFKLADRRCDGPGLNRLILADLLPLSEDELWRVKTILERLELVSFVGCVALGRPDWKNIFPPSKPEPEGQDTGEQEK